MFDLVERIRQASIRFHRDNEVGARRELAATLDSLDNDQTLAIVRAFSYFSHLANIAEDQHHIRRNRAHVVRRSAPRPGSLRHALQRARASRASTARRSLHFFDSALVSPVLTAHPTEVRRKSTLTRELEIAALLDERERHRRRRRRARAQRGAAAPRDPAAVAHQHAAADAAQGDRRGRQRPLLLRLHVLPRIAAPLRARSRTSSPRIDAKARGRRDQLVPARRLLDRRRPRRQPVRHRAGARARRRGCRARARSAIISTSCTSSAANCRSAAR